MLRTVLTAAVMAASCLSWIPVEVRGAGRGGAVHVNGYTPAATALTSRRITDRRQTGTSPITGVPTAT